MKKNVTICDLSQSLLVYEVMDPLIHAQLGLIQFLPILPEKQGNPLTAQISANGVVRGDKVEISISYSCIAPINVATQVAFEDHDVGKAIIPVGEHHVFWWQVGSYACQFIPQDISSAAFGDLTIQHS